jgi:hypothetical protein
VHRSFFNQLIQSTSVCSDELRKCNNFTYKVAAGQGVYTWNDYNGNGAQELGAEVAPFMIKQHLFGSFTQSNLH